VNGLRMRAVRAVHEAAERAHPAFHSHVRPRPSARRSQRS
jgi:hypothetical protein